MSGSASHWATTNKAEIQETLNKEGTKSRPPMWSLPREAYTSTRSNFASEYNLTYGNEPFNLVSEAYNKSLSNVTACKLKNLKFFYKFFNSFKAYV